jgi:2-dehydro-3-deoxyphosphooctonate aldolase (KDO 8-P synthase)
MAGTPVQIGNVVCGQGHPLVWIAGPCVIESHALTLSIAECFADIQGIL